MTVPVLLPASLLVPISLSVPVQLINPLVPVAILVLAIIVVKSKKNITDRKFTRTNSTEAILQNLPQNSAKLQYH